MVYDTSLGADLPKSKHTGRVGPIDRHSEYMNIVQKACVSVCLCICRIRHIHTVMKKISTLKKRMDLSPILIKFGMDLHYFRLCSYPHIVVYCKKNEHRTQYGSI